MLTLLSDLPLLIPLILLPFLLSISIFKDKLDFPIHWWTGILLLSLAATCFHALGVHPDTYSSFLALGIILGAFLRRKTILHFFHISRFSFDFNRAIVFFTLLVLLTYGVLQINTHAIIGGDVFPIWLNKTKSIFSGIAYPSLPVVQYPSLIPTFNAFAMKFTGGYHPNQGLYFGLVLFFFWIFSFFNLLKSRFSFFDALVISFIAILSFDKSVFNGMQDTILMMGAGMASIAFIKHFEYSRSKIDDKLVLKGRGLYWVGIFFSGMLPLIKSEGIILGAILVGLSMVINFASTPNISISVIKRYILPVFIFILLVTIWPVILYTGNVNITNIQGDNLTLSSLLDIPHNLGRVPIIMKYFMSYVKSIYIYFFTSLVLSGIALWLSPKLKQTLLFLWCVGVLNWLFISIVFLSTRAPLIWHLDTAFNRLMSQHFFIYILSTLIVVQDFSRVWVHDYE